MLALEVSNVMVVSWSRGCSMDDRAAAAERKASEIAAVATKIARQMGGSFRSEPRKREAYVQRQSNDTRAA